jgi:hypothetical protein
MSRFPPTSTEENEELLNQMFVWSLKETDTYTFLFNGQEKSFLAK